MLVDHLVNNAGISNLCMFEEAEDVTKFTPVMVKYSDRMLNILFWYLLLLKKNIYRSFV